MKLQLPTPPSSRCPDDGPGSSEHRQAGRIESPRGLVQLRLARRAALALVLLQLGCPVGAPAVADRTLANLAMAPVAVNWGSGPSQDPALPGPHPAAGPRGALPTVAVNWGSEPARPTAEISGG
jgi:hypothetical protein